MELIDDERGSMLRRVITFCCCFALRTVSLVWIMRVGLLGREVDMRVSLGVVTVSTGSSSTLVDRIDGRLA